MVDSFWKKRAGMLTHWMSRLTGCEAIIGRLRSPFFVPAILRSTLKNKKSDIRRFYIVILSAEKRD